MHKIRNSKKGTILFFSPYFHPYISGITQYPYRLFSDHKISLNTKCLTFRHDPHLLPEEKINDNLTIKRMPYSLRISKGFISPASLFIFWKEIKHAAISIINLPSIEGIPLVVMTKLLKKPVIIFLHCEVSLPFSLLNTLISFILNCGVFFQLFFADKIIVETKDYYLHKWPYILFFSKMHEVLPIVNNEPSDAYFEKRLTAMKRSYSHAVGFCGRIASEKGIEVLIHSLSQYPNTILFFAGPIGKQVVGEEAYYKKIIKMLTKRNIHHVFLGPLSSHQLSAFYRCIDVLVLPSLNKTEAFGMVQVEAMLQGTPVIATNLPGVRVPIRLTKMGLLIEPNNSEALTEALHTVIHNKQKYTNAIQINKTKKIFDKKETIKKMVSLLAP